MKEKSIKDNDLYEARFGYKERASNARFVFILLLIFWTFFSFRLWWTGNFGGVVVDGLSMSQTLWDNEKLIMRYTNERTQARRGDIIVVYVGGYEECKNIDGGFLIKRLIAVEGDKVRCTDGEVEICYAGTNEYVPLDEPYAYYGKNNKFKENYDFAEYTVGEGEIFFLGDNRSSEGSSIDSRYQETGKSHLDRLYKAKDVYGIVPKCAIENQKLFSFLFF